MSAGLAPNGESIIAKSSRFYLKEKQDFLQDWAQAMNCEDEQIYETELDGKNGFQCYKRNCGEHDIVRCEGNWGHGIKDSLGKRQPAAFVYNFMLSHPRKL